MSAQRLEAFLARLYVDAAARQRFLADPHGEAANAGLSDRDCAALENIDMVGLELAADSFSKKRAAAVQRHSPNRLSRWFRRI